MFTRVQLCAPDNSFDMSDMSQVVTCSFYLHDTFLTMTVWHAFGGSDPSAGASAVLVPVSRCRLLLLSF